MKALKLEGQRFGRLLVLKRAGSSRKTGTYSHSRWLCLCDCGKEHHVSASNLKRGYVTSCGCFRREFTRANQLADGQSGFNKLIGNYRKRCAENGTVFDLSDEQFRELTRGNCYYCGAEPAQFSAVRKKKKSCYIHNGVDRLDSAIGYIVGNCVPCCKKCNYMKLDMPVDKFLAACLAVVDYQKKRGQELLALSLPKIVPNH